MGPLGHDPARSRAVVVVGAAGIAGDSLTISVNVSADSTATAGVKKASLIVNAGLAVTQDVVTVVSAQLHPIQSAVIVAVAGAVSCRISRD